MESANGNFCNLITASSISFFKSSLNLLFIYVQKFWIIYSIKHIIKYNLKIYLQRIKKKLIKTHFSLTDTIKCIFDLSNNIRLKKEQLNSLT